MNGTLILIAEDDDMNMKLFRDLALAEGFRVAEALNGRDALSLARSAKPQLILMDVQLPDVSGLEAIRALKEDPATAKIPILAVTAYAMRGDEDRIRAAGADAYMSKPINVEDLLRALRDLVA